MGEIVSFFIQRVADVLFTKNGPRPAEISLKSVLGQASVLRKRQTPESDRLGVNRLSGVRISSLVRANLSPKIR